MKKALIFTMMLFLASGITVKAQTEKGKWFLSGSNRIELNIGQEKYKYEGDVIEGTKYNYFDFDFQPKAGYFFIDNLTAGIYLDLDLYSYTAKDDNYFYKSTYFVGGPFARYYFNFSDKFIPFVELQAGFGIDNEKMKYSESDDWDEDNWGVFTYRGGIGATYFFNDMVGLDLFLGYLSDAYSEKESENPERETTGYKDVYGEIIFQVGVVVTLGD